MKKNFELKSRASVFGIVGGDSMDGIKSEKCVCGAIYRR